MITPVASARRAGCGVYRDSVTVTVGGVSARGVVSAGSVTARAASLSLRQSPGLGESLRLLALRVPLRVALTQTRAGRLAGCRTNQ